MSFTHYPTIDLDRLIKENKLDVKQVAKVLFPENTYPELAVKRVIENKSLLNSAQLKRLSVFLNMPIKNFYNEGWDTDTAKNKKYTFTKDNYTVILDLKTNLTVIYDDSSEFFKEVLFTDAVPLSVYFKRINGIIKARQKKTA